MVVAVLLVGAGALTINAGFTIAFPTRTPAEAGKTGGSFAIINAVFYLIDAYFASLYADGSAFL